MWRFSLVLCTFLTVSVELFGLSPAVRTLPSELVLPARMGAESSSLLPEKASQLILSDDFEGTFPGQWQLLSATTANWGQSSYRASGGSHSVYCAGGGSAPASQGGPYFDDMQTWMEYGPFSLEDASSASFAFDLWMKTQPASGDTYFDYAFYGLSLDGTHFSGFKTAGDTQGWDARSFAASDITSIQTLGQAQVWFAIVFISDSSTNDEGVYIDNILLTKEGAVPCSLSCSATVPASGQSGEQLQFSATATATACSSGPSYRWDFGDGSSVSTSRNPSHSYSADGSYSWTMTATAESQTCTKTGVVSISSSSINYDREYWVPAAAHASGDQGSQWRTDLGIFNPGNSTAAVRIDFHKGSTVHSLTRSLSGGASELLEDVIGDFGLSGSGALEILSDTEVYVTSRTYNEGPSGTFGQFLDGTDPVQGLGAGQSAMLPQLREDSSFRTNIGLLNTSDSDAVVNISLFDGAGNALVAFGRTLHPGVLLQENKPFANLAGRSDMSKGSAEVRVSSGSGVLAYASVIDNQTQDPTTIPMKLGSTEVQLGWVAAAAHAVGNQGSQWRTDLGLLNRQGSTAHVTLIFHSGGQEYTLTKSVGSGVQKVLTDVISMMGLSASGSLEVSSDLPIYVTSRTYNEGSAGSFGQFLDGYSPDVGLSSGQEVFLPQLSENSAFRSNIGFVNTSSGSASVDVSLLSPGGSAMGQFSKTLTPGQSWQKNQAFSSVAHQSNITGGVARVRVSQGSGVIAYASVVDNSTNDPTTIPMKGAAELGGILGTVKTSGGAAISGASVSASGRTTATNGQGYYVLDSIPVASAVSVAFSKDGYVPTVKVLRVVAGESNTQDALLFPAEVSATISAVSGGSVSTNDGAVITIPPNSLVTSTGQSFTGTATVTLTSFDPSVPAELEAFPGEFEGVSLSGETVGINTFGFVDVTVSAGSETLQLATGATAGLDIPIPTTLQAEAPATIPSWWFDPDTRIWYEEGVFNKFNHTYRTSVPHFSIWNCDVASTRCYVSGRVVDGDGVPVKGARMNFRSFRRNGGYVGSAETSTPADGTFRVPVDANADIEYWASKGNLESAHGFDHACANNGEMYIGDIVLGPGGQTSIIGITLTWGADPRDLDSHLAVPLAGGGWEHLYYSNKVGADAVLDTDDTDGNGPEIFTINTIHDGTYRYSVHQFAGSGDFPHSGATVSVVGGGVSYRSYTPPASGAGGDDDVWRVFDLLCQNGHCSISMINDYLHDISSGDASSFEP